MTYGELKAATADTDGANRPMSPRDATWRYLGDRAAADNAYCARFGVTAAPEPYVVPGGGWAYALPTGASA